jgi:hypothetical protein
MRPQVSRYHQVRSRSTIGCLSRPCNQSVAKRMEQHAERHLSPEPCRPPPIDLMPTTPPPCLYHTAVEAKHGPQPRGGGHERRRAEAQFRNPRGDRRTAKPFSISKSLADRQPIRCRSAASLAGANACRLYRPAAIWLFLHASSERQATYAVALASGENQIALTCGASPRCALTSLARS